MAPVLDGPDGPQDARWAGHIPHSHVRLRRPGRRAVRDRPVVGPAGPRFFRSGLARTGSTCEEEETAERPAVSDNLTKGGAGVQLAKPAQG